MPGGTGGCQGAPPHQCGCMIRLAGENDTNRIGIPAAPRGPNRPPLLNLSHYEEIPMQSTRKTLLLAAWGVVMLSQSAYAGLFGAIKSVMPGSESPPAGETKAGDAQAEATAKSQDAGFDLKADLAAQAERFVEVENPDRLGGIKRVVIPSFMVEFVTEAKADTQIDGIAMISGAPSNAVVRLKGGNPDKFQEVADLLYDQTVAEFAQAGIEVVALDRLRQSQTYQEIAAKGEKAPREEEAKGGKGIFHTAKELPLYYMDEVGFIPKFQLKLFNKPKEDVFLTFGTKFGAGFATAGIPRLEEQLAKEFDATVMKVRITVMGGSSQVDHSFWTGHTVSVKGAGAFVPMVNRYAFIKSNGDKARLSLKESLNTNDLGELVDVTSGASKAMDTARNTLTVASRLLPVLSGGRMGGGIDMGYGNSVEYEWRIEPGTFEKVVKDYYPAMSRMFLYKLREPGKVASSVDSAN
jgi:hypothetical protein